MTKMPVSLIVGTPVIAATIIGLGGGMIAYGSTGNGNTALIVSGAGIVLGFMWASTIWLDRLEPMFADGRLYQKEVKQPRVQVELRQENTGFLHVDWIDLPAGITMHQLASVGELLQQNGYNFSHAIAGKNGVLTRKQFESLRDKLIGVGLARWNSPHSRNQGCSLLAPGRSLFKKISATSPTDAGGPKMLQLIGQ
jgi:hypothetical protein